MEIPSALRRESALLRSDARNLGAALAAFAHCLIAGRSGVNLSAPESRHKSRIGPARGIRRQRADEAGMSEFGGELWDALEEAAALFEGERAAAQAAMEQVREEAVALRRRLNLTQAEMAPLMGMSLSGYRKWEQGQRAVSGPAAVLLKLIEKDPEAVRRALAS